MEVMKNVVKIEYDDCKNCQYFNRNGWSDIKWVCLHDSVFAKNQGTGLQCDRPILVNDYFEGLNKPVDIPNWCPLLKKGN